ncbi:hypothetical protein HFO56_00945 [Rhizobium laguerreae]|uniref:hypothetical protein n=1 Tax=Rhizobium laguerreae TaxID=1076926 RepID=UPI001C8FE167|nr:hypothetical protein [Rhizobium laguerreae]MBY3150997.1 hypothetical protein [Rhizobium laguerreae]
MPHEDVLSELIAAESPLEWAFDNLIHVRSGTAAAIFDHPFDPGLVLRLSDYPDGWFRYADETRRMQQEDGIAQPFRPTVHWMADVAGTLVAVTERLEPLEDGTALSEAAEAAIQALSGDDERWTDVERHAPGFREFCADLADRLDLRPTNFLRRGNTLVFNDPYSAIPFALEQDLRERYRIAGSFPLLRSPAP